MLNLAFNQINLFIITNRNSNPSYFITAFLNQDYPEGPV
jgi:hypothetical protein